MSHPARELIFQNEVIAQMAAVGWKSGNTEQYDRPLGGGIFEACKVASTPKPRVQLDGHDLWMEFSYAATYLARTTPEVAGEVAGEVTGEVRRMVNALSHQALGRTEIQALLGLKGQANFRDRYLLPALNAGILEMTIPSKPNSSLQKYRLTAAGRKLITPSPTP